MNLRATERIAVVVSLCWLALATMASDHFTEFFEFGIIPVIIIIGIMWICRGRKKSNDSENGDGD